MSNCSVPHCSGRGGFRFPRKNSKLFEKWCIAIRRQTVRGQIWRPSHDHFRVCEKHFKPEDIIFGENRKTLVPGTIPSQCLAIKSGLEEPKNVSSRSLRMRKRRQREEQEQAELEEQKRVEKAKQDAEKVKHIIIIIN
jgi:hypothetical protein